MSLNRIPFFGKSGTSRMYFSTKDSSLGLAAYAVAEVESTPGALGFGESRRAGERGLGTVGSEAGELEAPSDSVCARRSKEPSRQIRGQHRSGAYISWGAARPRIP